MFDDGREDGRDDRTLMAAHVAGDPTAFTVLVAGTATGSGRSPCAPCGTARRPPTRCRTR